MSTDDINSPRFETRRDCWKGLIVSNLPPHLVIHEDQIWDAACTLADHDRPDITCVRAALKDVGAL